MNLRTALAVVPLFKTLARLLPNCHGHTWHGPHFPRYPAGLRNDGGDKSGGARTAIAICFSGGVAIQGQPEPAHPAGMA